MRAILIAIASVSTFAMAVPAVAQTAEQQAESPADNGAVLDSCCATPMEHDATLQSSAPETDDTVSISRAQAESLCREYQRPANVSRRRAENILGAMASMMMVGGPLHIYGYGAIAQILDGSSRFCRDILNPSTAAAASPGV